MDDGNNGGNLPSSGVSGPTSATNTFTPGSPPTRTKPPSIAGLDAISANTYSEGGAAIVVDANATPGRPRAGHLPQLEWRRAARIERQGGANAQDVFGVTGSGSTGINFSGANIRSGSTVVQLHSTPAAPRHHLQQQRHRCHRRQRAAGRHLP